VSLGADRQPAGERRAVAFAGALGCDRPAMQFHEFLHESARSSNLPLGR
jgi:hypothetical protein